MGLRAKFNLAILAAFVFGFCVTGILLKRTFEDGARTEAMENARIMMSAANAVRHYTTEVVEPLTGMERDGKFVPASVPAFAAQTSFRGISREFPAYTYKEAALNPTNLADRAADWEADIINAFRNSTIRNEMVMERDTPIGTSLNLARPIAVTESACLACHSQPSAAPPSLIASYGNANGFGWRLNEVIGAQIVSLPLSVPLGKARQALILFLAMLTGVFLLMLAILNALLHYLVLAPVAKMSRIATEVSLGNLAAEQFAARGRDEVGLLAAAFNRMRHSLETALRMLEEHEAPPVR